MNIKEKFENFLDEQKIKKEIELIKAKRAEEARIKAEKIKMKEESKNAKCDYGKEMNQTEKINGIGVNENIENLPAEKKKFKFNMEQLKEVRPSCNSSGSYRSWIC